MTIQNTSEDNATLPSDNSELSHVLTTGENNAISTDDDTTYASVSNTAGYAIFQFENDATGKVSTTVTWDGKSDVAPSSSPVYLQIYRIAAPAAWETIDSDSATAAGTDFVLTATVADLTNYKDGSEVIYCRVYQATSAGETIMAQNTAWNDSQDMGSARTYQGLGQSFLGNGSAITKITFRGRKQVDASITGTASFNIYNTYSGVFASDTVKPTGSPVATVTFDPNDWSASYEDHEYALSTPYGTNNGDVYVATIEFAGGDATNYLFIRYNTTSAVAGNFSGNNGSWFNLATWDMYYIIKGTP